jgi:hypothetical protein
LGSVGRPFPERVGGSQTQSMAPESIDLFLNLVKS